MSMPKEVNNIVNNKMAAQTEEISLRQLFEESLKQYNKINNGECDPTTEQSTIKNTIHQLEECTKLVNAGQIFSSNEMLEEVSTDCIQFLAIPAMLGTLVGRLLSHDRLSVLETSEIYFKDFLNRGKEYGFVPDNLKIEQTIGDKKDLTRMVVDRNEKLRRFQEQKQLEADLVLLKEYIHADDEKRREYFIKFVKSFVTKAEDELRSIAMEKPLAERMKHEKESGKKKTPRVEFERPKPLEAIIITKNELQKKVFGAGYPSLPTMTVDEFYTQRVKDGVFPSGPMKSLQGMEDPEVKQRMEEEEDIQKENAVENDDAETLARTRNMDEFKDEHRRGWGNRHNRS